ncbi:hypothetical protein BDN72DRAFT_777884 [Pluteus cervinus]|uniref:Uncharacterized protein n=1 Tax=Pluteus cervinus TaxID=181527 RepID=A0ACD3A809_9AGAR|nr:hypothetical protein BDN72DRAFT_777884 [Pluteus cervinus]
MKPAQPHTLSFFRSKGPQIQVAKSIYLKVFIGGCFLITIAIFAIFSVYWGALWKTPVRPLQGWVVDFDGDQIGTAITQGLTSAAVAQAGGSRVAWTVLPASDFPNGLNDVADQVLNEKVWVAIAINANASTQLRASLAKPDPSYDSTKAISVYGVEARNENAFRLFVRPTVQQELGMLATQFALQLAHTVLTLPVNVTDVLVNSPQTMLQPVGYQIINLRPFDVPVAGAVTFVGLIYLLILSFFLVNIGKSAREASGLERLLTTRSLILVRLGTAFIGYFFLSFFYSLLSRAFQLPFDRFFGNSGFLIFWMLNWIGMLSLGLALESMITILTIRFIPFFMMLWIISNVSVCFLPIEVLPGLFKYGYAFPFYNVSRAVRAIVFGTHNSLGRNFGILIAWVAISCITLPIFQIIVSRREQQTEREQAAMAQEKRRSSGSDSA